MKNELFLENTLTLFHEDEGATLRCCVMYDNMLKVTVHEPKSEEYKNVYILFTDEQMEQLVALWNEWKNV